ncbi:unnamed protein product [Urochloa decumbens]|uniref:MATH domain-containing protein n=1 Tax=Urochloa decumbens TaxID=240449 RepID=A0ABC9FPV4_9POAL
MASSSPMAKLLPQLFRHGSRHLLSGTGTATTARRVIGSHMHKIECYSQVERSVAAGESVRSSPFLVGGRWWQLLVYPNGVDAGHRGFVSADLALATDDNDVRATASYRVSILDGAGNPAHTAAVGPRRFWGRYDYHPSMRPTTTLWGEPRVEEAAAEEEELLRKSAVERLVAAEELRKSAPWLARDDFIRVQCDVAVTEIDTKPLDERFMRVAPAGFTS